MVDFENHFEFPEVTRRLEWFVLVPPKNRSGRLLSSFDNKTCGAY